MNLSGLDCDRFLAESWQRCPRLIRGALPGWQPPLDPDDLAGLACEEGVTARLIHEKQQRWTVRNGPFEESDFAHLGERDWTLLVQDVDKWVPQVSQLLDVFAFLPDWRIDDVMVSFAADGGSVGPHVDHYDVFLLQGTGRRRWQIDQTPDPDLTFREDQDLRILEAFRPTDEWILEPGDILYLPPGIPHFGVGMENCMTWSIGMRAPSCSEILRGVSDRIALTLSESQRYTDAGRKPAESRGQLAPEDIQCFRKTLVQLLSQDDDRLGDALAGFLTEYQLADDPFHAPAGADALPPSVSPNPWARWLYRKMPNNRARVFVNGDCFEVALSTARSLVDERCLDTQTLGAGDNRTVLLWWTHGLVTETAA